MSNEYTQDDCVSFPLEQYEPVDLARVTHRIEETKEHLTGKGGFDFKVYFSSTTDRDGDPDVVIVRICFRRPMTNQEREYYDTQERKLKLSKDTGLQPYVINAMSTYANKMGVTFEDLLELIEKHKDQVTVRS